ncbi:hypothetical protein ACFLZC_02240 [Patescibacteria group bacterium]
MDPEIQSKLDAIYTSVEKTRKYIIWMIVISLSLAVLPLLIFSVILPRVLDTLSGGLL